MRRQLAVLLFCALLSLSSVASLAAATGANEDATATAPTTSSLLFGGPNLAPPRAHFLLSSSAESDDELAQRRQRQDDQAWKPPEPGSRVLVLGSGGLVGRAVKQWLLSHGYLVSEVVNRSHIDLRSPGALDVFDGQDVRFVMLLACDVGGAKFMQDQQGRTQIDMMENNVRIYQTVFQWIGQLAFCLTLCAKLTSRSHRALPRDWLAHFPSSSSLLLLCCSSNLSSLSSPDRHRLPFLFSSTSLVGDPDTYGSLKRLGESWVRALRLGRIARLWNVYGPEPAAPHWRSHVLADWAASCARSGKIQSLTSGIELRQFVHADDCANALGTMMQRYDQLELVTDIAAATYEQFEREQAASAAASAVAGAADASAASAAPSSSSEPVVVSLNGWVSMRDVGEVFSRLGCPVSYNSDRHAAPRAMLQPRVDDKASFHRRWWKPTIGLQQGIEGLIAYYVQLDAQKAARDQEAPNLDASLPTAAAKDDDVPSQQQSQQQQAPLPLPELHASAGALHPPAAPLPRRSSVVISAGGKDEL